MAVIFDGKAFADNKLIELKSRVGALKSKGINLRMASIFLTSDSGSELYTKLKKKKAEEVGIEFIPYPIEEKDSRKFIDVIDELNMNTSIQGILLQKPSGENDFTHEEWGAMVMTLNPAKDVDGLTPENLGLVIIGTPRFIPATVKSVMDILGYWKIDLVGKSAAIVGASEILGKPLSLILTEMDATVTLLHSKTPEISLYTKKADILISAAGKEGLITADMVKKGSAIIDVGAPKGDVRTDEVAGKVAFLSPVPGGAGPLTIANLIENLINSIEE